MEIICKNCGCINRVNGLGRKSGQYPVQNVLDAYQAGYSMYRIAEKYELTRGTVKRILNNHGIETGRKKKNAVA